MKQVTTDISKKAVFEDLVKVEQNMLLKLEEVVGAMLKSLANKNETKKALIYLESKVLFLHPLTLSRLIKYSSLH